MVKSKKISYTSNLDLDRSPIYQSCYILSHLNSIGIDPLQKDDNVGVGNRIGYYKPPHLFLPTITLKGCTKIEPNERGIQRTRGPSERVNKRDLRQGYGVVVVPGLYTTGVLDYGMSTPYRIG